MQIDDKQILKNQVAVRQFLKRTQPLGDTPALIQLVLSDRSHLVVCRAIVNQGAGQGTGPGRDVIQRVCRQLKMDVDILRRKLIPVAQALGLLSGSKYPLDYYRIIGVLPTAGPDAIRKAFRRKALKVHPDSGRGANAGNRAFAELHTAYKTLMDPTLRGLHDQCRHTFDCWVEAPAEAHPRWKWRRLTWLLWLLLFLAAAAFVLDAIFTGPWG